MKKVIWNTDIHHIECMYCKSTDISQLSFNKGYINAEIINDEIYISKLKPLCKKCDLIRNNDEYMKFIL
jgi:hypothetical protein